MSEHTINLSWRLQTPSFDYEQYNRYHRIEFDGRNGICASAAPEYHGSPSCVNPEQSFVAAMASCHMLTFLALASKKGFVATSYEDPAVGVLGKNNAGKTAITAINLKPVVTFNQSRAPSAEQFSQLHDRAHAGCFIANSIASCVRVEIDARMIIREVP